MAYSGGNDDRKEAAQIRSSYVEAMTRFTRWLVDNGYRIRLFGGDNKFDGEIAEEIQADLRQYRPDLEPSQVTIAAVATIPELIQEMAPVGMVVATRYHNVICALKLCKPTISLGYSRKFISLMEDVGLTDFHQFANSVDADRLIEQFKELESRQPQLRKKMADRNTAHVRSLEEQFARLSSLLFPADRPERAMAESKTTG